MDESVLGTLQELSRAGLVVLVLGWCFMYVIYNRNQLSPKRSVRRERSSMKREMMST